MIEALSEGATLGRVRADLLANGHNWRLITGSMVFVHAWQYAKVMRELVGHDLKASHMVVAQSLEHLVAESIAGIGGGAWAKWQTTLMTTFEADFEDCSGNCATAASSCSVPQSWLNRAMF